MSEQVFKLTIASRYARVGPCDAYVIAANMAEAMQKAGAMTDRRILSVTNIGYVLRPDLVEKTD